MSFKNFQKEPSSSQDYPNISPEIVVVTTATKPMIRFYAKSGRLHLQHNWSSVNVGLHHRMSQCVLAYLLGLGVDRPRSNWVGEIRDHGDRISCNMRNNKHDDGLMAESAKNSVCMELTRGAYDQYGHRKNRKGHI